MSKRLDVTMFGTGYRVGAILLSQQTISAGVAAYGRREWHVLLMDIALGVASSQKVKQVNQVVGANLSPLFVSEGIAMQDEEFGMEIFHEGRPVSFTQVDAARRIPRPEQFLSQGKAKDVLGVYHARRDTALSFRWDDVEAFRQEDVTLSIDNCTRLLGGKFKLELAVGVTWKGGAGRNVGVDRNEEWGYFGHVFHQKS
ncbi:MAG: hypothetical protein CL942_02310 [Desulfovibrio sp.]|nr:hypothetical protein [Desulfovibrio sp.]